MSTKSFQTIIIIISSVAVVLVAVLIYLTVIRASEYLEFAVAMGLFAFLLAGSYAFVITGTAGARGRTQEQRRETGDGTDAARGS